MATSSSVTSPQHSSCFLRFVRHPTATRETVLSFGVRSRHDQIRCKSLRSSCDSHVIRRGEAVVAAAKKRHRSPERCAAEGILIGGGETEVGTLIPERMKVVMLTACMMCLCNADRVVMSVAVVPLAEKLGWSSSFLGVVQVFS